MNQRRCRPFACALARYALIGLTATLVAASGARGVEPSASDRAAASKPAAPTDSEGILGKWQLAVGNRNNASDGVDQGGTQVTLTFEADNRWTAIVDSQGAQQTIGGSYYLDATQTPKTFDLTLVAGDYKLSVYAIYDLTDDRLRLRFHLDGGQRPADFATPAEGASIYEFRRVKE